MTWDCFCCQRTKKELKIIFGWLHSIKKFFCWNFLYHCHWKALWTKISTNSLKIESWNEKEKKKSKLLRLLSHLWSWFLYCSLNCLGKKAQISAKIEEKIQKKNIFSNFFQTKNKVKGDAFLKLMKNVKNL